VLNVTPKYRNNTKTIFLFYIIFPCALLCSTSGLIGTNSTNITRHRGEKPFPGDEASSTEEVATDNENVKQSIYKPGLALRALGG